MHAHVATTTARRTVVAFLGTAVVLALGLTTPPAVSAPLAGTVAAADSHPDPTGDATNGAADISSIDVGNDYLTGSLVIWVNVANRTSLSGGDFVLVPLDTDLNPDTGINGFEYGITMQPGNNCALVQAQGSNFAQVAAPSLKCDFFGNAARIEINPADLGGPKAINFAVETLNNDAVGDQAPDSGTYSYSLGSGNVPLVIDRLVVAPTTPKAGKTLVARLKVFRNDILETLTSGTVTCSLRVGGKTVPVSPGGFTNDVATCSWRLPKSAKGKRLAGSISVSFGGSRATKAFTVTVG